MGSTTFKLVAAGAAAVLPASAQAFYFPGWPADGLPRTPTLVRPTTEVLVAPKGYQLEDLDPVEPLDPINRGRDPGTPQAPPDVPEPGTLLLAAAGAAAVAARRRLFPASGGR